MTQSRFVSEINDSPSPRSVVNGPLSGVTVLELAGIGALPFGAMMLADMGADVIRVDRAAEVPLEPPAQRGRSALDRGRLSIGVDLKTKTGVETVLRLVEQVDVLVESNRPGVAERLGVGPDVCLARNPRLVYGRLTGWGQDGPLAQAAGHDLNYVSLTGAVHSIGPAGGAPVPPLQILGDFAGGGMLLAYGVACALVEVSRSGRGQVVDAAMVDGVMAIMGIYYSMANGGMWTEQRGTNLFDGGSHFYNVYETADGRYVSVAPVEPQFYALLLEATGLESDPDFTGAASQWDRARWPVMRAKLAAVFATRTRDEWCALLEGTDTCFAPVLTLGEAQTHPHTVARSTLVPLDPETGQGIQVTAVPRFSRTPGSVRPGSHHPGADTDEVLSAHGFSHDEIASLRSSGAIR